MMTGVKLNITEGRAVLHTALRANRDENIYVDGKNVVPEVYEVREKLYTLEKLLTGTAFMRASKSTILNLDKVKSLSPAFGGRFEAVLDNGEKTIISRQYVSVLKERLGL